MSGKFSSMLLLSNFFPQFFKATIMKFLPLAYLAALLGVSSAQEQMQINYYSDYGCSDYIGQVDVTWATTVTDGTPGYNCYDFNYGNSVNIANCYEDACACLFFTEENCQGDQTYAFSGNGVNCLANSASLYSFQCWYN
jgi:hypothetical protein